MGAANSIERLDVPLDAQLKPVVVTHPSLCATEPMSLQAKVSVWTTTIPIVDVATGQPMFEIRCKLLSPRKTLFSANGDAIATLTSSPFSTNFTALEGTTDLELFRVNTDEKLISESSISIDFVDRVTGEQCHLTAQGNWNERVVLVYLQRGVDDTPQPIARFRRPQTGMFRAEAVFIELMPGVDTALIVLAWVARWTLFQRQEKNKALR